MYEKREGKRTYVDTDIDVKEVLNRVLEELLLGSITLESDGQETVLLAPVSQVVHAEGVISVGLEDVADKGSNDGRAQVTGVEGLGDVGRRELDNDLLVTSRLVASPLFFGVVDLVEQRISQFDVVQEKVHKGSICLGRQHVIVQLELCFLCKQNEECMLDTRRGIVSKRMIERNHLFTRVLPLIYLSDNVGGDGGGCALEAETGDREGDVSVLGSPGSLQGVVEDLDVDIDKSRELSSQNILEGIQGVSLGVRAFDGGNLDNGAELGLLGSKGGSLGGDGLLGVLESLVNTLNGVLALLALIHTVHPGSKLFQVLEVGEERMALGVGGDSTPDGIIGEEGLILVKEEGG
jgi:hypothetical protein